MRERMPCGTRGAYERHIRHGENPCDPCREAASAYFRSYRRSWPMRQKINRSRRAAERHRALYALAAAHPDLLAEIEAELAVHGGRRALIRAKARVRLAHELPDEYARLLEQERAKEGTS